MSNTDIPATIHQFGTEKVGRTANFSASLMGGRGSINITATLPEKATLSDGDAVKALKAELQAQVAHINAALDKFV